ncbi:MAG: hypothetical protein IT233_13310 [Bacteroidia bacterium]|nr:hypothetical protein [Bacteroidia bacterium]
MSVRHLLFFSVMLLSGYINALDHGFIANAGQVRDQQGFPNPSALYILPLKGMNIVLKSNGFDYEIYQTGWEGGYTGKADPGRLKDIQTSVHRVEIRFAGMNSSISPEPEGKQDFYLNYYNELGNFSYVPVYRKIIYRNIYPFTDIVFMYDEKAGGFKYDIHLRPGADPNRLRFVIRGAGDIRLKAEVLEVNTPAGAVNEHIPNSYFTNAPELPVPVSYRLSGDTLHYRCPDIINQTLVIDPASRRLWGTYYGDAGVEYGQDVTTDISGNSYLTGYTLSNTNIATTGAYQTTLAGSFDAFIVKFNAAGVRQWGTYFGGNSVEASYAITISNTGAIYIAGDSFSTSGVASTGAHQTVYGGGIDDAFLARFDANGQRIWSTYYGGILHDISYTLTTDPNGNAILGGHSESPNDIATTGSFMDTYAGGFDIFIVKFDPNGVRLWGSYYGDFADEESWAVACDNAGNIYCTGFTASNSNFSTTGIHQPVHGGGTNDAYLFKMNSSGTSVSWCTYYGGSGLEVGTGIVVFPGNEILLCGNTASPNGIASNAAYQLLPGSADDAFLVRFDPAGNRVWGTYFGGNDVDYFDGMVRDIAGNILLCGSTLSTNQIATPGAWQAALNTINNYDAMLVRFSLNGQFLAGTYYGGSSNDNGYGIGTDGNGAVYIAGTTTSADSIASTGSHMSAYSGVQDAFLARFCMLPVPEITPSGTTLICVGDSISLSANNGPYSYLWNSGSTTVTLPVDDTTSAGTYLFYYALSDPLGCVAWSDTATIIVDYCSAVEEFNTCETKTGEGMHLIFCEPAERTILLFNAGGQLLGSFLCTDNYFSFPEHHPAGIYLLQITEEKQCRTLKVLVR